MEDDGKKIYLIYRTYSSKERKDPDQRTVFYGWTGLKSVRDAFLMQRNSDKYKAIKCYKKDIADTHALYLYDSAWTRGEDAFGDRLHFMDEYVDYNNMIDVIKLISSTTGEEVMFFTTSDELHEGEIRIQRLKEELCSMETMEGKKDVKVYLEMILNLDPYYGDALRYIGYRPKELDILFDSSTGFGELDEIEMQIHEAYDAAVEYPREWINEIPELPGLSILDDVSSKVIYSLENFIKVLKEDL